MVWLVKSQLSGIPKGSIIGGVFYTLQDPVESVISALKESNSDTYVALPASEVDSAIALLNAGVKAIVVESVQDLKQLVDAGVPANRIVVSQDTDNVIAEGQAHGVIVNTPTEFAHASKLANENLPKTKCYVYPFYLTESEDELVSLFVNSLSSDRTDSLIPTVVSDQSNRVLGLCYSSPESISEAVRTRTGVYQSRTRGLWYKGKTSGATQQLIAIKQDCDNDTLQFIVEQTLPGFCHNNTYTCFGLGESKGLNHLEQTIASRKATSTPGSYTNRLFTESGLLDAKIKEEAEELCEAESKEDVAWEAADLLYFMMVKLAKHNVSLKDVEANLDMKSLKVTRRKGDAKPKFVQSTPTPKETPKEVKDTSMDPIRMHVVDSKDAKGVAAALQRPAQSSNAFELSKPIVEKVRSEGDKALLEYTLKFEKAKLDSPVLTAPFDSKLMDIEPELKTSIDLACDNIDKFHRAQLVEPLRVETSPGVICSRFSRPIKCVGLYVPGGTAILPSTAIHLGMPAKVAGCEFISIATPPRSDGTPSPEVMYVAHKIGANQVVLAGGAQGVAAMAYGTESVRKVDKILGPGNQFVTAAKMICSTDVNAQVSIDMPAGPSEVLVIADKQSNKSFVASDLLSQAEHGADSQVVLISIKWTDEDIHDLQIELEKQALALPRCDVVRKSIAHSSIINVQTVEEAFNLSNDYAPEHLILQIENASDKVKLVNNAGSVFVGALSPESCGDYTSGTNHTLPTYGYANQYSGVNTDTYLKYITSQELDTKGLGNIGPATVAIAEREGLQGHANAVKVRLAQMAKSN